MCHIVSCSVFWSTQKQKKNCLAMFFVPNLPNRRSKEHRPCRANLHLVWPWEQLAVGWAFVAEREICSAFETTGEHISVLWQAPAHMLIGGGKIFAASAVHEVAFTVASPSQKSLTRSAVNLFFMHGQFGVFGVHRPVSCLKTLV